MKVFPARGLAAALVAAASCLVFVPLSAQAQTVISPAGAESLADLAGAKADIERAVVQATPESLARAKEQIQQAKTMSDGDRNALLDIVRGVSMLLYPAPSRVSAPAANGSSASKNGKAPAFFATSSPEEPKSVYALYLAQLVDAFQGKIFAPPASVAGSALAQLLPSLAIFKTSDGATAQAALGYSDRFWTASVGGSSVIPLLVAARAAKINDASLKAYRLYQQTLDAYPEVWPARLELGILSLEMSKPVGALAFLAPLAASRNDDALVLVPYALALYRNGRLAESGRIAQQCLEYGLDSADLMTAAAHACIDRRDFAAAQPLLEALEKKAPADKMFLYLRALQAQGRARNAEALKYARKALRNYPEDPVIMVLLADVLFSGSESDREEAVVLCKEAVARVDVGASSSASPAKGAAFNPLEVSMREEAKRAAKSLLLGEAYRRQDWAEAAKILDTLPSGSGLDKKSVATILRKSGQKKAALAFAREWYEKEPHSEAAAEAYLRALASYGSGIGLASAAAPRSSDASTGQLGLRAGQEGASPLTGSVIGQPSLVGLVFQLLAGSYSSEMRSYLYYLRGTLQADLDEAIDSYRQALLERADNIEAMAALAMAYTRKGDSQKALFFVRQAQALGVEDVELAAELKTLEVQLSKR